MQVRQVGEEIVSNEESEENEIVDDAFKVVCKVERLREVVKFEFKVFTENGKVQKEKVLRFKSKTSIRITGITLGRWGTLWIFAFGGRMQLLRGGAQSEGHATKDRA